MLIKLILIYLTVMSLVSMAMHAVDKRRATLGRRRIPERSLHSIEFIGGWPGALFMTRMIRHKTSKPKYMWTLYAIAASHIAAILLLGWFATR